MKTCSKCGQLKDRSGFYADNRREGGLFSRCKECVKVASKICRDAHREEINERTKKYREKHPEKVREAKRKWQTANPEKRRAIYARWKESNPERVRALSKKWKKENPEITKMSAKKTYKKMMALPKNRIRSSISVGIRDSLQSSVKAAHPWEELVGYTVEDLKTHLGSQFGHGMTWDNYGEWHIDHIIPVAVFNFETPEDIDFKRCWALKNLQPLWANENRSKGARLDRSFQPSLAIAI